MDRQWLLNRLDQGLSTENAQELVYALNLIQWDNLMGQTKRSKLRALIEECERAGTQDALIKAIQEVKPGILDEQLPLLPESVSPSLGRQRLRVIALLIFCSVAAFVITRLPSPFPSATLLTSNVPTIAASSERVKVVSEIIDVSTRPVRDTPTVVTPVLCPSPQVTRSVADFSQMMPVTLTLFIMGRDDSTEIERPAHPVTLTPFSIDQFEVTNLQYQKFVREAGYAPPPYWQGDKFPAGSAYLPVVEVSWADASAYCHSQDKRLPTEAEWEATCRGGRNRLYTWGIFPESGHANIAESQCHMPLTVGSYGPLGNSLFGVSDLLGNAAEWVSSSLVSYPYRHDERENAPVQFDEEKVYRGGSWRQDYTCSKRATAPANIKSSEIGFRCVEDLP